MARLIFLLIFSILTFCLKAQVNFGVKLGGGLATLHTTQGENKLFRATPAWQGGVFSSYTVNESILLQSSLTCFSKGYRDFVRDGAIKYNDYFRVNYIGLTPVQFFYTPKLKPGKLLIGAGPTLAYGLGGKWREKSYISSIADTKGKLIFLDDLKDAPHDITVGVYGKKIDLGGLLSVGGQFNRKVSVLLEATGSILNVAPKVNGKKPDYIDRNFSVGLSVQYAIK